MNLDKMSSLFYFFKQKTAYELRIIDWSSDVCSSDLIGRQWATARAPEQWLAAGDRPRALPDIVFHSSAHRLQQRDEPGLRALAGDRQNLAQRQGSAGQRQRFGNAQARAVKE